MKQSSIQFDLETRRMIVALAKWWGFPSTRNTTAIIRKLVIEAYTREKAKQELANFDKVMNDESPI